MTIPDLKYIVLAAHGVLVSAGIELIFFLVVGMVLCFLLKDENNADNALMF